MPTIYEYTYFSQQKKNLPGTLRLSLNSTLSNMRMGIYNNPLQVQGRGQNLVKNKVGMTAPVNVWENRIDGHWRVFYYTNPGGNITALCIGHLDPNSRLMMP